MSRIVGVDLSLTSTGIAIVDTATGLVTVHTVTSKPPTPAQRAKAGITSLHERIRRLDDIERRLFEGPLFGHFDLAVIEAPSYGSSNGGKHERSGLWWAVACRLYDLIGVVAEVPPSNRMRYATGSGAADKDRVLAAVIRRYPEVPVDGNDEADALVLAAMGARHLDQPIEASLPAAHLAAMDRVEWPTVNAKTGALL